MTKIDLVKKGISEGNFPKFLFKYRAFNKCAEDIFKNNQLWFSQPNNFNDPFDFSILDKGNYLKNDIYNYLISNGLSNDDANNMADTFICDQDELIQVIEKAKEKAFKKYGTLCLSKIQDNILMWSHYSENHTGFVIGFDMEKDLDFYTTPLNVNYQDDYPSISYLIQQAEIVTSCIKTKFSDWKYEQELRILKSPSGFYKFKKEALSKVILGCKISDSNKNDILRWIKDYKYKGVLLYQAEMSKTRYALEIKKI